MSAIYTVGHSNKPVEQFTALLKNAKVEVVIDVRTRPRSRWCPWFNQAELGFSLNGAGLGYEWRGNNLGGLGENVNYDETIDELALRASRGQSLAVMCSEMHIKDCHRKSKLTPSFHQRGLDVVHILWDGTLVVEQPQETADTPTQEQLF